MCRSLCVATRPTLTWDAVAQQCTPLREARSAVPLILYRDANAWCPFSHRAWFWLEQLEIEYTTERIHLGGDPREPAKQPSFFQVSPRGTCPALKIGDEAVTESLDILLRLEQTYPRLVGKSADDRQVQELLRASGAFDTDCDEWLHNTQPGREGMLRKQAMQRLEWLEAALAREGGPFLLGDTPSIADAAFLGFLTRLAHNYKYFKGFDVTSPSAGTPRLAAWLEAIDATPGGAATRQDAYFEQRIYQAHPARRVAAEPCMALHPTVRGVGEPSEYTPPAPPTAPLVPGGTAAREAAKRLHDNRAATAAFLARKRREAARVATAAHDAAPAVHWKAAGKRRPIEGAWANAPHPDDDQAAAAADGALLGLAGILANLCTPAEAASMAGGPEALGWSLVLDLGGLIGTPRDMSSAAAAQVRSALREMAAAPSAPEERAPADRVG